MTRVYCVVGHSFRHLQMDQLATGSAAHGPPHGKLAISSFCADHDRGEHFTSALLKPLFDAQNDSRSKTEIMMEMTGAEIWNVVDLRA